MQTEGINIDKHFRKNLGLYFMEGLGSDGSVVKGITAVAMCDFTHIVCAVHQYVNDEMLLHTTGMKMAATTTCNTTIFFKADNFSPM